MVGNKITITDIIKFLGACICLLLGFLRKTENIGENTENQYFQDYLNQAEENQNHETNDTNTHGAANTENFQKICLQSSVFCQKINFFGDFSEEEKGKYLKQEIDIIQFIDKTNNINPQFNNTIKIFKINNDDGNRRGYATRDTVVLNLGNVQSDSEFTQLSSHELGHIFDLGFLQGTGKTTDPNYTEFNKAVFKKNDPSLLYYAISWENETIRKDAAKKKDFCSGYGMSNPFEDFSECFNLYLNNNKLFKYIAKKNPILAKKYNFIATIFKGTYLNTGTNNIALVKNDANRRARDTTKIQIN